MKYQIVGELLTKYRQVFAAAWQSRKQQDLPPKSANELAFLPAALELQENPPHPAARITLWALLAFILIAFTWACLGKIDIVAVAPGRLIVSDRSKTIQPLEAGVVKSIHVQDGQMVQAGQLLIELDGTVSGAENTKQQTNLYDAELNALRAKALLVALDNRQAPVVNHVAAGKELQSLEASRLALSQWQELQARLSTLDSDTSRKQAERAGVQDQIARFEQTLPIIKQREKDFQDLALQNFVSKHGVLEKQQARIEAEQDLANQRHKKSELDAAIRGNAQQRIAIQAEFRRTQHDLFSQASEQARSFTQDVVKTGQLQKQTRLTAPVAGIVQQLAVHTVGGVVTPAQALLVIVPKDEAVEAEVVLENKDIGFVNAGQAAAIKIETFNYTKYGLIEGLVRNVSFDAVPDEKLGLIYQARIKLHKNKMNVDGKWLKLAPGMAVTVEIKTGQRRIIEYFLSPLMAHVSESVRER
ncbi:HlyD family type I secretion periplasmic adaptor subunit [Iodobacter ciconiae]|uniref:Membrane fusion protein (MFP) family protein n=1 Tax=Iodobacter ciconiae TaxID=2496266 RepID=A0A3S8ZRN6_9NEIS|nr:HlyD family type I secretion periplasmic adaptor subunit [Iodobacter ciconiae]AZN36124.1 HlyD family type I secretion periplasmic adaptor subunit [Iodobacter ciconiae]